VIVIVCPGQGSQTPGFLSPWLELPGLREHLTELSDAAGVDLVAHGTVSDEDTIKDTAVAQPLLVGAGLLALRALTGSTTTDGFATPPAGVGALAGHSVGEITAAAAAGVLREADAMRLVALRGRAMAEASAATPTGMSAVLGGDATEVLERLAELGLTAANANGGGQVVAAGTLEQLAGLAAHPPAKARVIALKVAGAFHTAHMSPAVTALEALRPSLTPADPVATLMSNFDGRPVATGEGNLDSLIAQVSRPVRWDLCMESMQAMGVTGMIELSPAGTLTGLAKRGMRGTATLAVKSPEDLDAARSFIEEHSRTTDLDPTLTSEGPQ